MSSTEKHTRYFKSNSNIILIGHDTDKIIQELFYSLLQKYQIRLEPLMKGNNFIFDYVLFIFYLFNTLFNVNVYNS